MHKQNNMKKELKFKPTLTPEEQKMLNEFSKINQSTDNELNEEYEYFENLQEDFYE